MIEKIPGVYGPKAVNETNIKKNRQSVSGEGGRDGVEFSSFAVELSKVSAELKKIPDVREDLVEGFRKQIQEGTYAPDLEKIARSLIVAGLLNEEE
ncbi:flagellar biosynthesis anti-sigma factor FlgM [Aminivibrio sp.]|jgi:negative regulator of flagellin synthesis FlgM|uniref:flagellar biosynthesis anti-sigma factor FlgM n=1 Tax=Aminivibrio sp. TaxID=1872489 RepID=UPI001A4FCBF8|nr:flagellar biosynthesis anti-sigma factor FlgM [Aminivibrio sp.]MBL3539469.1 flagellar biosynthesis anti-sigma factor FlgM [Aminivibrio sp.]